MVVVLYYIYISIEKHRKLSGGAGGGTMGFLLVV